MLKLSSKRSERHEDVFLRRLAQALTRVDLASMLERPRTYFMGLIGCLALLILWAGIAQIDQVVRVEGKVIPAGRSQQIQHLEGGLIASIDTSEGAAVKRGDLLLTIDDTMAGASLSESTVKLNSQRTKVVRLEAETQGKNVLVLPPDLVSADVSKAERSLFDARRARLNQEIAVHQGAIRQRTADIDEAMQRKERLVTELATAHQRLEMVENMAAHGAASKLEILDARSREQRLRTEISETEGVIPRLKAAIAEEQARIETRKAEYSSQAHDELVLAVEEIEHLKQSITTAADRLKRTEIRAPVDGVINRISVNTVGGVVKPGETLIELIPSTEEILIEAKAHPRDRGYLRKGLDAQVRVSAYDTSSFGLLKGKVTEVSADSIQEMHGEPFFQVNVLVKALPSSYAGHLITPGMTVTADVVTGRRTFLSYLLSPLHKFTYSMFRDPR